MSYRNIIVIGASAGGVETLRCLVQNLPTDLAAAIFVVVHFPTYATSVLPNILNRAGSIAVSHPINGQKIQLNHIYIAPPNYHMVIERDSIQLVHGPRENGHRPAIDTSFRSAAGAYHRRVIGVVLSGLLDDGTAGLATIKQCGGVAIVQDPQDALFAGMPSHAIAHVQVDYVLPISQIADTLVKLVQAEEGDIEMADNSEATDQKVDVNGSEPNGLPENGFEAASLEQDAEWVKQDKSFLEQGKRPGEPSMLTCPDCGGVLWELNSENVLRYRCHVGHAYSADSLAAGKSEAVETALWTAYRALEEQAALFRRLANQAQEQHRTLSAKRFDLQALETSQKAAILQQILTQRNTQVALKDSE